MVAYDKFPKASPWTSLARKSACNICGAGSAIGLVLLVLHLWFGIFSTVPSNWTVEVPPVSTTPYVRATPTATPLFRRFMRLMRSNSSLPDLRMKGQVTSLAVPLVLGKYVCKANVSIAYPTIQVGFRTSSDYGRILRVRNSKISIFLYQGRLCLGKRPYYCTAESSLVKEHVTNTLIISAAQDVAHLSLNGYNYRIQIPSLITEPLTSLTVGGGVASYPYFKGTLHNLGVEHSELICRSRKQ